jgi:hypothetical protein
MFLCSFVCPHKKKLNSVVGWLRKFKFGQNHTKTTDMKEYEDRNDFLIVS